MFAQRSRARPPPIDPAVIVTVTRKALEVEILETGRIQPREKADLKSRVAGQVQAVLLAAVRERPAAAVPACVPAPRPLGLAGLTPDDPAVHGSHAIAE